MILDNKLAPAKDIKEKISLLKREHMNLRFSKSLGDLKDSSRIRKVRRDIARLFTILRKK